MSSPHFDSWGRIFRFEHQSVDSKLFLQAVKNSPASSFLAFGNGRSYGDVGLNDQNFLIDMSLHSSLIHFDIKTGLVRCQAGMRFDQLLPLIMSHGWFLPVTPGTKYVTVGGAIANDIHGKNHHRDGTFGHHVRSLKLLRSDGEELNCSAKSQVDLFRATIGGLGLTGLILEAEFQLISIHSPYIKSETIRFDTFDDFLQLSQESEAGYRYTVAWLDLVSNTKHTKGVFFRGNHSQTPVKVTAKAVETLTRPVISVPFNVPSITLNPLSMTLFNNVYWYAHRSFAQGETSFNSFFYPLDKVLHWNKLYGRRGFLQLQFVLPPGKTAEVRTVLANIARSKQGSFLCVAKKFGKTAPAGVLTFPMEGITIAIDFPNNASSRALYKAAEEYVIQHGGRLYPAKDAMMSPNSFKSSFDVERFRSSVDPKFSSTFWRRVSK
jgi:FAD/FMN-containing dehydrogenase